MKRVMPALFVSAALLLAAAPGRAQVPLKEAQARKIWAKLIPGPNAKPKLTCICRDGSGLDAYKLGFLFNVFDRAQCGIPDFQDGVVDTYDFCQPFTIVNR